MRFLESELPELRPEDCLFHILPIPYEASVSYGGGTMAGPSAIIEASSQLETWTGAGNPSELGIYTWPDVNCEGRAEMVLERIERAVDRALDSRNERIIPVGLGGEHTVTLGILRALAKRHGRFGVVQFDAHADLRDSYEGSRYSHACVMRRAVDDLGLSLFQIAVRNMSLPEVVYRESAGIHFLDARELAAKGGSAYLASLKSLLPPSFPEKIFLTFDIDALDSSLMPATGTPDPGGLFWWDALRLAELAVKERTVLGFDVVELAPMEGFHAADFTAARLTYELMDIVK
ncbi:agmatinase [Desulfovibrio sp. OttesenSCG-928-I05]|nr:agmatinase [Desulfovibrio sp. OttesenSCG-928-I05]